MKPVRVLVAPLVERTIPSETFWHFLQIAARAPVDGYDITGADFMREDMAREKAVESLLSNERNTHILMLDIDHKHPPDIVKRLSRWAIEDRSRAVIGALCFRRSPNYEPLAYIPNEDGGGFHFHYPSANLGLIRVARVGMGAVLIAREVFEAMPERGWFAFTYDRILEGHWPCTSLTFCDRARAKGFHIYVDTNTESPHMSVGWVGHKTHESFVETNAEARNQLEEVPA